MTRMDEIARNLSKEQLYERGVEYRFRGNEHLRLPMPDAAIAYFLKAAERGHVEAQYALGCMYENGEGSPVDIEKATEWYTAASSWGLAAARDALERLGTCHCGPRAAI